MRVLRVWTDADVHTQAILGLDARETLKARLSPGSVVESDERIETCAHVVAIYVCLSQLLSAEVAPRWVNVVCKHRAFKGRTPLNMMMEDGLPGIRVVRAYLESKIDRSAPPSGPFKFLTMSAEDAKLLPIF